MNRRGFFARVAGTVVALFGLRKAAPATLKQEWEALHRIPRSRDSITILRHDYFYESPEPVRRLP